MAAKKLPLGILGRLLFGAFGVVLPPTLDAQSAAGAAAEKSPPKSIADRVAEANEAGSRGKTGVTVGGDVLDAVQVDRIPQVKSRTSPAYPLEMRKAGISGQVVLRFVVDKTGDVRDVTVVSSTRAEFEAAAIKALGQWKFVPGIKGGHEVNTRLQVPIIFALEKR